MDVDEEVKKLVDEMKRLGSADETGTLKVKFGVLFRDDRCQQIFEALIGTLRAAKKRKIVSFEGEMLLSPAHDDVDIVLCKET